MAKYSSVGMVAFTLNHNERYPTDAPDSQVRAALMRRIADLDEHQEWGQAVAFDDTVPERSKADYRWSTHDDIVSFTEGWRLSLNIGVGGFDDGLWVIEMEDEVGKFSSDQEALEYVIQRAKSGSELHHRALKTHMTPQEKED